MFQIRRNDFFIIQQLARRDKRRDNTSAVFGQAWQILNPFINMAVLVIVFSTMFSNSSFINFPVYCAIGTWFFGLFREGTFGCLSSLTSNKQFLTRTYISNEIFVLEKVYVAFFDFLLSGIVFVGISIVFKIPFRISALLIIPDLFIFLIFIVGMGKILAILNVVFPDVKYLYQIFILLVFYGSALFYSAERLTGLPLLVLSCNPVYIVISIARIAILDGCLPHYVMWLKLIVYAVVTFVFGTIVFRKGTQNIVAKL